VRTHTIVAIGSCAFALISHAIGDDRISAGVITGIGFLGAGAIVRAGKTAHGLTTAASIWAAAAGGLAAGSGVPAGYATAVATTALTWVFLALPDQGLVRLVPTRRSIAIAITFDRARISHDDLVNALRAETAGVRENDNVEYYTENERPMAVLGFSITLRRNDAVGRVLATLALCEGVERAAVDDEIATS
jgi:putative Mg2+ transporter-C (MgtC) family protein